MFNECTKGSRFNNDNEDKKQIEIIRTIIQLLI